MTGTFRISDQGSTLGLTLYPKNFEHPVHLLIEGNTLYVTRTTKSGTMVTSGVDTSGHAAATELRTALFGVL